MLGSDYGVGQLRNVGSVLVCTIVYLYVLLRTSLYYSILLCTTLHYSVLPCNTRMFVIILQDTIPHPSDARLAGGE